MNKWPSNQENMKCTGIYIKGHNEIGNIQTGIQQTCKLFLPSSFVEFSTGYYNSVNFIKLFLKNKTIINIHITPTRGRHISN